MQKFKTTHTDSASLAGFYFGLLGVLLSAVGIALSVYALYSAEKSLWLSLSGWISAILIGFFLSRLCLSLMRINASIHSEAAESIKLAQNEAKESVLQAHNEAKKSAQKTIELTTRVGDLEYANTRLNEINSFIVSNASIGATKARRPTPNATRPKKDPQSNAKVNESEEVTDDI